MANELNEEHVENIIRISRNINIYKKTLCSSVIISVNAENTEKTVLQFSPKLWGIYVPAGSFDSTK